MNSDILVAKMIAFTAHQGQTRHDGVTPYISHPAYVADHVCGEDRIIIAWLHDVLEDTQVTRDEIFVMLPYLLILGALDAVTRQPDESYAEYIERVALNPVARDVKIEDLKHNLGTVGAREKSLVKRWRKALGRLESL